MFLVEDSNLWLFCVLGIAKYVSVARHLLLLFVMYINEWEAAGTRASAANAAASLPNY